MAGKQTAMKKEEIIVFDDSFENNLENESNEGLLFLSVDFHHPDLTDKEKKGGGYVMTDYIKNSFFLY